MNTIKPRTKYSREIRDRLRRELGGKCERCPRTDHLQFDCRVSQGPAHHALNWRQRLNFYRDQHKRGNLQLLCPACHVDKTLADIAARQLAELHGQCPHCQRTIRLRDLLKRWTPPPVEEVRVVAEPEFPAPEARLAECREARSS